MDITLLNGVSGINALSNNNLGVEKATKNNAFDSVFKSALSMLNETNDLSNAAKEAEVSFALGLSNNTYDLQVAQEKANLSLQYTVQVRNKVIEAYKEIMNLQF